MANSASPGDEPEGWKPAFPAWVPAGSAIASEIVFACFGIQSRGPHLEDFLQFHSWFNEASSGKFAPAHLELAEYIDQTGFSNNVYFAYWESTIDYEAWEAKNCDSGYWTSQDRLSGSAGIWREVSVVPSRRLEALISGVERKRYGLSALSSLPPEPTQTHGYWGSMRDRIPAAAEAALGVNHAPSIKKLKNVASLGVHLRIMPPENLCIIRSGQDWSGCSSAEVQGYFSDIYPHLVAGMKFLDENPIETNCVSCRFLSGIENNGIGNHSSSAIAYFMQLSDLEKWSKQHKTHLRIFGSMIKYLEKNLFKSNLNLWHEVYILAIPKYPFEYLNCHPSTGIISFIHAM